MLQMLVRRLCSPRTKEKDEEQHKWAVVNDRGQLTVALQMIDSQIVRDKCSNVQFQFFSSKYTFSAQERYTFRNTKMGTLLSRMIGKAGVVA